MSVEMTAKSFLQNVVKRDKERVSPCSGSPEQSQSSTSMLVLLSISCSNSRTLKLAVGRLCSSSWAGSENCPAIKLQKIVLPAFRSPTTQILIFSDILKRLKNEQFRKSYSSSKSKSLPNMFDIALITRSALARRCSSLIFWPAERVCWTSPRMSLKSSSASSISSKSFWLRNMLKYGAKRYYERGAKIRVKLKFVISGHRATVRAFRFATLRDRSSMLYLFCWFEALESCSEDVSIGLPLAT